MSSISIETNTTMTTNNAVETKISLTLANLFVDFISRVPPVRVPPLLRFFFRVSGISTKIKPSAVTLSAS